MDARLYFADARWAALRLRDVERLIDNEGEDWSPSKGTAAQLVSDPTGAAALRHIASAESLLVEKESILAQLEEAALIVRGVGEALGENAMIILGCYYLDAMIWDDVAEVVGMAKRQCLRIRDMALDWVDSVGFAHAKEGTGTAE